MKVLVQCEPLLKWTQVLTFFITAGHLVPPVPGQVPVGPEAEVIPGPLQSAQLVHDPARKCHVFTDSGNLVQGLS